MGTRSKNGQLWASVTINLSVDGMQLHTVRHAKIADHQAALTLFDDVKAAVESTLPDDPEAA